MDSFKGRLTAGIRVDGDLLYNLPPISYFKRRHAVVFHYWQ